MSTEKENVGVESAQSTPKKNRRGISNKTKATSQLKFHEKDASTVNGLFVGHLDEVTVNESVNADGKQFTGMSVPRLVFHFASNHSNANERRHIYYTLNPVESNVETIPGGNEEWKVNNVFNWIKHILDVYVLKGRELTEAEEDALTLPFDDTDDNGEFVALEPETVLAGYRYLFNNAAAMLNGSFNLADGEVAKPLYKTADGKFIPTWMKLLRHKKVKNQWRNISQNGELGFDTFIGNGVVELVKKDCPPVTLRIDLAKESITPKEVKQTPTIGAPGMPIDMQGGVMASSPFMGTPGMPIDMQGGVMASSPFMGTPDATGAFGDAGDGTPF